METTIRRLLTGASTGELKAIIRQAQNILENRSVKIAELDIPMSVHLKNVLDDIGITDLLQFTDIEKYKVQKLKGVGVITMQDLEAILEYYNISFKSEQISLNLD